LDIHLQNEPRSLKIRRAIPEDAEAISTLIKSVAHYFTVQFLGEFKK
jgi:hypothetical protein